MNPCGRYGYRRIIALFQEAGWPVAKDSVQRACRREGLKVPQQQRPRGRLWLNYGSCVRLRPERRNHVWSYDFVSARTHDGRTIRMVALIDEFTRECLAICVAKKLGRYEAIEALADVMLFRGIPEDIRSEAPSAILNPAGATANQLGVSSSKSAQTASTTCGLSPSASLLSTVFTLASVTS